MSQAIADICVWNYSYFLMILAYYFLDTFRRSWQNLPKLSLETKTRKRIQSSQCDMRKKEKIYFKIGKRSEKERWHNDQICLPQFSRIFFSVPLFLCFFSLYFLFRSFFLCFICSFFVSFFYMFSFFLSSINLQPTWQLM